MSSHLEVVIHPIRIRILALFGPEITLTTKQIAQLLPDLPAGSLYRHIKKMTEAEVLHVVEEKKVKGAIERVYALESEKTLFSKDEIQYVEREQMKSYFAILVINLLRELNQTTEVEDYPNSFSFLKATGYLSNEEFATFAKKVQAVLKSLGSSTFDHGKKKWTMTFALTKTDEPDPIGKPEQNCD